MYMATSRRLLASLVLLIAAAAPLQAQSLRFVPRTGGYGALQLGGGNFTFGCESLCVERELGASHGALLLGAHIGQRLRLEGGIHIQKNRDEASDLFTYTAGAAVYLVGNLHVRGAAAWYRASVQDTNGTFEGNGGPGFLAGAGYDLFISGRLHLTPYVQYSSGSISNVERTAGGAGTTPGDVRSLSFGVGLSFMSRTWECTTAAGERIRVTRRNAQRFLSCLNEVEARYGRTRYKR